MRCDAMGSSRCFAFALMRHNTMAQSDSTRGDATTIQTTGDVRRYALTSPSPCQEVLEDISSRFQEIKVEDPDYNANRCRRMCNLGFGPPCICLAQVGLWWGDGRAFAIMVGGAGDQAEFTLQRTTLASTQAHKISFHADRLFSIDSWWFLLVFVVISIFLEHFQTIMWLCVVFCNIFCIFCFFVLWWILCFFTFWATQWQFEPFERTD